MRIIDRRESLSELLRLGACAALVSSSQPAASLGRIPYGGQLQLSFPYSVRSIDPHDISDPFAAFFANTLFEPLYGVDQLGRPYPKLARELPLAHPLGSLVALRKNLVSSRGKKLDRKDLLSSLLRSASRGGGAVLAQFGAPKLAPNEDEAVLFPGASPTELAQALSSPLTALVPRSFDPQNPDGCGAFSATLTAAEALLTRNVDAARGPAYLETVTIRTRDSLSDCLRDFETGKSSFGWLGRGLYRPRAGTRLLESETGAWVVLHSGRTAARWGLPGTPSQLLRSLAPEQFARFGLRVPAPQSPKVNYAGPSCEILTRDDSGYLRELGSALCGLLSNGDSRLSLKTVPHSEIAEAKRSGNFCFLLETLRQAGPRNADKKLSLLHAVDPRLSKRPPRSSAQDAVTEMSRTLPLGVLGDLVLNLGVEANLEVPAPFHLGAVWLRAKT